jgi:hypothetical protein
MIRQSVMNRLLGVLLCDIPVPLGSQWFKNACGLGGPLLQNFHAKWPHNFVDRLLFERALRVWFRLLQNIVDEVPAQSKDLTILTSMLVRFGPQYRLDSGPLPHPPVQFHLLVEYHLRICEGTNYEAIRDSFLMLEHLDGLPSTPDRVRRYVDTMGCFMGKEITGVSALRAA